MDVTPDDTSTGLSASLSETNPPDLDPGLYALPPRDRVIKALSEVGLQFGVGAPTPDGYMNVLGASKDRLTLVQLIGNDGDLVRAEVLLGIPRGVPAMARWQGKLLIVFIALVIPGWADGPHIVGPAIGKLRRKSPQKIHAPGDVQITMTYRKQQNLLLRIEWPSRPTKN